MAFEAYWIGKGLDLDELWNEFDEGGGYIEKFQSITPYMLRLTFDNHPVEQPLFDHEVLYKTIKGTFHDVKQECLTWEQYNEAAPIFLYRVERGSGVLEFLAQLDPLLTYVAALGGALMWYRGALAKDSELDEQKWKFIRSQFPGATDVDLSAYMKAWTTWGRRRILHRLIEQGLHRVEVSREPFDSRITPSKAEMVDAIRLIDKGRADDV